MLKRLLRQLMLRSPHVQAALASRRKNRKQRRWDDGWHNYFAAGGTIRKDPRRQY